VPGACRIHVSVCGLDVWVFQRGILPMGVSQMSLTYTYTHIEASGLKGAEDTGSGQA
jgi:hypothetical protein